MSRQPSGCARRRRARKLAPGTRFLRTRGERFGANRTPEAVRGMASLLSARYINVCIVLSAGYNRRLVRRQTMPSFSFKGTNRKGEQVSGERVADTKQALAMALRREQIFLLDAQEKKAGGRFNFEFGGNPTPKDVAVFTRQFSVMIDSGVPLVQCLEILADTQANKKFAAAIKAVQVDVESGNNLAAAMKNDLKRFDHH